MKIFCSCCFANKSKTTTKINEISIKAPHYQTEASIALEMSSKSLLVFLSIKSSFYLKKNSTSLKMSFKSLVIFKKASTSFKRSHINGKTYNFLEIIGKSLNSIENVFKKPRNLKKPQISY
jgi:hypothetical protein